MSITVEAVRTQISDRPQLWPSPAEPPELLGTADGVSTIFTLRYENFIPGTLTVYESTPPAPASGTAPVWTAISTNPIVSVGTTSETAVNAPGAATITPASMANIAVGVALVIDESPSQETVIVTGVTGTTFTANFTMAHAVGFAIAGAPPYQVGNPNPGSLTTVATNATITFNTAPTSGNLIGARYQATAFSDADLANYLSRAQTLYSDDLSVLKRTQYDLIDVVLMDYDRLQMLAQGEYRRDLSAYVNALKTLKQQLRLDLAGGPLAGANVPAMAIGSQQSWPYQPLR